MTSSISPPFVPAAPPSTAAPSASLPNKTDVLHWRKGSLLRLFAGIPLLAVCITAQAQTFHLPLVTGTVASRTVNAQRRQSPLAPTRPPLVKKVPADLLTPRYALIEMGPAEQKTYFVAMLDEVPGKEPRLIVDCNHDGDLTNDPPVVWKKSFYFDFKGTRRTRLEGDATLHVPNGKKSLDLPLQFVRDDPDDPNAALTQDNLQYLPDYIREGTLKLGGESYFSALLDVLTRGDFRGNVSTVSSGTLLLIDVNHNGRIDPMGEIYDVARPFNIKGVTYELHVLDADGGALEIVKSKQNVKEILPPPDLSPGQPSRPFAAKTVTDTAVHFPADYKGKKVLLYFWASWCPDCARQNPFVVQAYQKYHARGLEVLGVSIEPPDTKQQFIDFTRKNKMVWPQIYDGKFMQSDLVLLYFIRETPTPLLIDGDTGKILVGREELLYNKLDAALTKFFPEKR